MTEHHGTSAEPGTQLHEPDREDLPGVEPLAHPDPAGHGRRAWRRWA